MYRTAALSALVLLAACSDGIGIVEAEPVEGLVDPFAADAEEEALLAAWDGAEMRIVRPESGTLLPWKEASTFALKVRNAAGEFPEVEPETVTWKTDQDPTWLRHGMEFEDDELVVGTHAITAEVALPTGDRLAHTVGGVRVQSPYAGTYAGLFTVDVQYQGIIATCIGSAVVVVDAWGETGTGDGDCLVSLLGVDLPLTFVFDLDNDLGVIDGKAGADIFGWFTYDFPAAGTLDPSGTGLSVQWAGNAFGVVDVGASMRIPRVSDDTAM